jgi:lantibiotic transport system ATP-binding protein
MSRFVNNKSITNMNIVSIKNLSHSFSKGNQVLKDLNLTIPKGSIYGFLGPNGAGKTTTLRILLGLLKNITGEVIVFEKEMKLHRIANLRQIGSLIEMPSLYLHLTARENLEIYRQLYSLPAERVSEVLELVDLHKTAKKRAKSFSLGMKQRLSIAIALLHKPSLLVLDEPTNGLDPQGIKEIRFLLKKLNQEEGTTIIISSHLLSEIDKIATHIGIIHKGERLFEGTLEELQTFKGESEKFELKAINLDALESILTANSLSYTKNEGSYFIKLSSQHEKSALLKTLIDNGVKVYHASMVQNDLEDIFLNMTSN